MELLKILFSVNLLFLVPGLFSQNLVLNPSFEEYYKLPYYYNEIDTFFCKNWSIPDNSSPDFFHVDSKEPDFGVPENRFSHVFAKSGNGFVGIYTLNWDGYMEHLTGKLEKTLQQGQKYKIGFFIRFSGYNCPFFTSNIGVRFSSDQFPLNVGMPFYEKILSPAIKADVLYNGFVKDTCWQLLQWDYVAKGNEKYITLGVFYGTEWNMEKRKIEFLHLKNNNKRKLKFYKNNQDVLLINPNFKANGLGDDFSYYFIDDVFVEPEIYSQ